MNFFEHQDQARRQTGRLVFLFSLAVAGIVVALYFASRIVLQYGFTKSTGPKMYSWWDPVDFAVVAAIGLLFILLTSGVKTLSLRSGGGTVAEMLGGRPVQPDTTDPAERRLLNTVEEMAIASGTAVPKVYILDNEEGINAFAAGYTPNDAAITVTRGALEQFNRDELQGVIAHEFSHILNGDMRLNIKLIGVLFGIFAIGIIGYIMLRMGGGSRGSRKGVPAIAVGGILLMLIGYIGTFAGRLIQSAVCRQREFLADSSAVQFTRNPGGISGALKKIGGFTKGSRMTSPKAQQASHLFFSQGSKLSLFTGLLATHPPLAERIRRIDPSFDGTYAGVETRAAKPAGTGAAGTPLMAFDGSETVMADPSAVTDRIGSPTADDLAIGAALLQAIPEALRLAVTTPTGAMCAVYALLLDPNERQREHQIDKLRSGEEPEIVEQTLSLHRMTRDLDPRARLPLADLAMPALRDTSFEGSDLFVDRVEMLVTSDKKVTFFEFLMQWMIRFRLEGRPSRIAFRSLKPLLKDLAVVLGAVARAGYPDDERAARRAFDLGAARVLDPARVSLPFVEQVPGFTKVGKAFDRLTRSTFEVRKQVIDACAFTALVDRTVTVEEFDLLRVISASLDCPLPPLATT